MPGGASGQQADGGSPPVAVPAVPSTPARLGQAQRLGQVAQARLAADVHGDEGESIDAGRCLPISEGLRHPMSHLRRSTR
jgi:hypothetical protein